jgi:hypothetical protein
VFTLQRSIEHGVNGFLSHAQDWHDVLRKTVGENDLPRIAERARVDATRRYSPAAQAVALRDALLEGR